MSAENSFKNIVIIGGGYAGIEAFLQLSNKNLKGLNLILVSQNNYFYHNVAAPRALVESSVVSDICVPFDRIIKEKNQKFIHGKLFF